MGGGGRRTELMMLVCREAKGLLAEWYCLDKAAARGRRPQASTGQGQKHPFKLDSAGAALGQ